MSETTVSEIATEHKINKVSCWTQNTLRMTCNKHAVSNEQRVVVVRIVGEESQEQQNLHAVGNAGGCLSQVAERALERQPIAEVNRNNQQSTKLKCKITTDKPDNDEFHSENDR